jgi:hypothetical protein
VKKLLKSERISHFSEAISAAAEGEREEGRVYWTEKENI